jgi:hypothetical protein
VTRPLRHRLLAAFTGLVLVAGACSDDDDAAVGDEVDTEIVPPVVQEQETGDIDVPEVPGTFEVAVPDLGFGIALPDGWQATVLSEDALERLSQADLARPSFLDAATSVASTGAVFYAAGVGDEGRVAELKVDVQDDIDTSLQAIVDLADLVVQSGQVDDVEVVVDEDQGRVRVDYSVVLPSAEDEGLIEAQGSQLFVPDGERLWSFIVTSEDEPTQQALLKVFESSIAFDEE